MYDMQGIVEGRDDARTDPAVVHSVALASARPVGRATDGPRGLSCPRQSLSAPFRDPAAPAQMTATDPALAGRRLFAVTATLALTMALVIGTAAIMPPDLPVAAIATVLILVAVAFLPISQGVALTMLGLWRGNGPATTPAADLPRPPALQVAMLLPIHEEDPALVFGNAAAMLDELARQPLYRAGGKHGFALFILSDTRTLDRVADEERAAEALRRMAPAGFEVHYRRRANASDRKMGNVRDWVETHGADWAAMLVLDADSLMSGRAIVQLADAMAADPARGPDPDGASYPRGEDPVCPASGILAFSPRRPPCHGPCCLHGRFGELLGAQCDPSHAGLRHFCHTAGHARPVPLDARHDKGTGRLILSHDFVEAALLRRAGWGVRILPGIADSYEEAPPTLIDHALRDRRWCRGNMQHLRLLAVPGLDPVSRIHFAMGALAYLAAPAWLGLILFWVICRFFASGLESGAASGAATVAVVGLAVSALVVPKLIAMLPAISAQRPIQPPMSLQPLHCLRSMRRS
jgi:membrane glycosyltransferase